MNNPIPMQIVEFLRQQHVVGIACANGEELWAASCFYAFDEALQRLIILTDRTTRHGRLMLANPQIAGTIAGQPKAVSDIEGVQFCATASLLDGEQQAAALAHYIAKHPIAATLRSDVWALLFTEIKHTENRTAFGHKSIWQQ